MGKVLELCLLQTTGDSGTNGIVIGLVVVLARSLARSLQGPKFRHAKAARGVTGTQTGGQRGRGPANPAESEAAGSPGLTIAITVSPALRVGRSSSPGRCFLPLHLPRLQHHRLNLPPSSAPALHLHPPRSRESYPGPGSFASIGPLPLPVLPRLASHAVAFASFYCQAHSNEAPLRLGGPVSKPPVLLPGKGTLSLVLRYLGHGRHLPLPRDDTVDYFPKIDLAVPHRRHVSSAQLQARSITASDARTKPQRLARNRRGLADLISLCEPSTRPKKESASRPALLVPCLTFDGRILCRPESDAICFVSFGPLPRLSQQRRRQQTDGPAVFAPTTEVWSGWPTGHAVGQVYGTASPPTSAT
ncbi:hypothetical protein PCL_07171 [Purpureocillium lilacinum]|uniref:Uncharacterized protein n=1 Tax=Purpureocillium lilacinum TaxID=33203 RepID=A0A2U3DT22_PURLI|nr:hypothetical protein PCL_07171 [Purpureocillium lilacinum]